MGRVLEKRGTAAPGAGIERIVLRLPRGGILQAAVLDLVEGSVGPVGGHLTLHDTGNKGTTLRVQKVMRAPTGGLIDSILWIGEIEIGQSNTLQGVTRNDSGTAQRVRLSGWVAGESRRFV